MVIYLVYKFVYVKYCKNKDTPAETRNPADPNHTETRLLDSNNATTNSNNTTTDTNSNLNVQLLSINSNDYSDRVEACNILNKSSSAKLDKTNQP